MKPQPIFTERMLEVVEDDHKDMNSMIYVDPFYFKVIREYLNSLEKPEGTVEALTDQENIKETIEKSNSRFLKNMVTPTRTIANGIHKIMEAYNRIYLNAMINDMPSCNGIKMVGI